MAKATLTLTSATLEKSYTTSGPTVTAYNSSYTPTSQLLYRMKVELMKVPGATVVSSSDGNTSGASDLWTGVNKVGLATGSNRSWILIKFDNAAKDTTIMLSSLVDSTSSPTQLGTMTALLNGSDETYSGGTTTANPSHATGLSTLTFTSLSSSQLIYQAPVVSSICYSSDGKSWSLFLNHGVKSYFFGMYEGVMYDQGAVSSDTVIIRCENGVGGPSAPTFYSRLGAAAAAAVTLTMDTANTPTYNILRTGYEYLLQPSFYNSNVQRFQRLKDVYRHQNSGTAALSYPAGTLFPNAQDPALVSIGSQVIVPWTGQSPSIYY